MQPVLVYNDLGSQKHSMIVIVGTQFREIVFLQPPSGLTICTASVF